MDEVEDSEIAIEDLIIIIIIIIRTEDLINRDNLDLEEGEEEDLDPEEADIKNIKINIILRMIRKLTNKLFIVN
jgi:hypothetical protein